MAFHRMRFWKEQAMSNIVYVSKAHGETGTYQPRFSVSLFAESPIAWINRGPNPRMAGLWQATEFQS
jgi:hypothetical protein